MIRKARRLLLLAAIVIVPVALFFTCDEFAVGEQFYQVTDQPLGVLPAAAALKAAATAEFQGQGGAPDYTYAVVEPGGGTIDPETGLYTAPSVEGIFTVSVTDRAGESTNAIVYVVVPESLTLQPGSATVQVETEQQFTASGGTPPYTLSITPAGLGSVDSSGVFTAGESTGTGAITLTDDQGASVSASLYVYDNATLMLALSANPIEQGETIDLYPSGGDEPYALTVAAFNADGYEDPTDPDGTLLSIERRYIASDSVGVFTLRLDGGDPVTGTYDLEITVLPERPQLFDATGDNGSNQSIELSWTSDRPGVDEFVIERASSGGTFAEIARVGSAVSVYTDVGLQPTTLYEYRMYAVAGGYHSPPTTTAFALPKP